MKNIALTILAIFAFSASASAQTIDPSLSNERKEILIKEAATADYTALTEYVDTTPQQQVDLQNFFQLKYELLNDPKLTKEEKATLRKGLATKFLATLNDGQVEKLKTNPELYKKLTN